MQKTMMETLQQSLRAEEDSKIFIQRDYSKIIFSCLEINFNILFLYTLLIYNIIFSRKS